MSARDAHRPWSRPDSGWSRARDACVLAVGTSMLVLFAHETLDAGAARLWGALACFYFVFYWRIAQFTYWANLTYGQLRATVPGEARAAAVRSSNVDERRLPVFHVLIAAYEAQDSIAPVLRAVHHQAYPSDRMFAWVITERSESLRTSARRDVLRAGPEPAADEALSALGWQAASERHPALASWTAAVTDGELRWRVRDARAGHWLVTDLLLRTAADPGDDASRRATLAALPLEPRDIAVLVSQARTLAERVERVTRDYARLLGTSAVYDAGDVAREIASRRAAIGALARVGRRLARRLSDPTAARPSGLSSDDIVSQVRCTQDVVVETVRKLGARNIHLLDPHNRGFKPGALNAAYRHLRAVGLLQRRAHADTFFLVIDADSLLPSHALSQIARELAGHRGAAPIMQLASIPTANFFAAGWYSRFIAVADALGAVGKWARSTRRCLKPDLHAGSGVVVPATIAAYIAAHQGAPWTETTLTEDARIIVGQFGMMNGARNTTRMAPAYLLEAVPASERLRDTYRSFWNQRRRWTTGGWDELLYMLSVPSWVLHAAYDATTRRWRHVRPTTSSRRLAARLRQVRRILVWTWDHFWWGIGGAAVLTHWWLVALVIAPPSPVISWLGLAGLLGAPLVMLVVLSRQLVAFTPGGISVAERLQIYLLSFAAIWAYALPVIATQLSCLFGLRSTMLDWRPTQKPRYQLAGESALQAADAAGPRAASSAPGG